MNTVKLIVVPGRGVDLFSLKKSFGIKKGPVKTPVALPIEIIAELVNQYNRPEIFEVVVESVQKYPVESLVYSAPVLLTADNYMLPYHEIAGVDPIEITVETAAVVEVKEEEDTFQEPAVTDSTDEDLSSKTEEVITDEEPTVDPETVDTTDVENTDETETVETTDAENVETTVDPETVDATDVEDTDEEVSDDKDPILAIANKKNKNHNKRG